MVHVSRDGKVIGSYPLSAMRTMIDRGVVGLADFYHMRGMTEWLLVAHGNFLAFDPLPEAPPRAPHADLPRPPEASAELGEPRSTGRSVAGWATVAVVMLMALVGVGYFAFPESAGSEPGESFSAEIRIPLPEEYPTIRKQAADGNMDAQVRLGLCELRGIGTMESPSAAVASFRQAADKGHPAGQFWLGVVYLDGNGVSKDPRAGFELIKKAAEHGLPSARYWLGTLYCRGIGTSRSSPEGFRWIRLAADAGVKEAQGFLGRALREGAGIRQNAKEAFRYLELAADAGVLVAQHHLAQMYQAGEGVKVNQAEALRYMRMAADKGHLDSIYYLGLCYVGDTTGLVKRDDEVGVIYLRQAADKGHAAAQNALANQYYLGEGVEKSEAKALEYFVKAAKQGNADAQNAAGLFYLKGIAVAKSPAKAFRYFYESGMQEDATGAFFLARCYAEGIGVEKQPDRAAVFYRIACDGGNAEAYAEYARLHFDGVGIVQDKTLAYAYGLVALAKGVESAKSWANVNPTDPATAAINLEQGKALAKQILAALEAGRPIPTISRERDDDDSASGVSSGSGMIFTGEGHCFTNHHVVDGASRFFVIAAGSTQRLPAELVVVDAANDLAILKVRGWSAPEGAPSSPPPVIDSKNANAGDRVFTFGYPVPDILSDAVKYTSGDINALSGMRGDQNQMQVSMPIHGGNSGGPVALEDGRVVGVVVSTANPEHFFKASKNIPQNINFAIKADYLRILAKNNGIRLPTSSVSGDPKQHVRAYTVQIIAEK